MPLVAKQMHPIFAADVSGVHLARVDEPTLAEIKGLLDRYAVLAFYHDAPLTDDEHVAFSKRLGPVHRTRAATTKDGREPRIRFLEIIDQSNLDEYGDLFQEGDRSLAFKRANRLWHTDMSFNDIRATYSLLSAHRLPPGGGPDTEFADMRAAYDALPAAMKSRIDGLKCEHSYWHSRVMGGGPEATPDEIKRMPPAIHPLVHVHPKSGRKVLYLASHACRIVGWGKNEGLALIKELTAHATRPEFVYAHKWRVGDVVIWDNLATMHRARPFDDLSQVRDVRRTTCREKEQEAA
jgi:alpha-ketoglutarate-dependent 2,4-dichlorophenoxyacetate dioxygenase